MEVEHRTKQGDLPQQEEYLQRFPQQERCNRHAVFARDATTKLFSAIKARFHYQSTFPRS